ncbi:MAG: pentapeptide repeat-containing protein [Phycisphaerales bacterium]
MPQEHRQPDDAELKASLLDHMRWLASDGKRGKQFVLIGATLDLGALAKAAYDVPRDDPDLKVPEPLVNPYGGVRTLDLPRVRLVRCCLTTSHPIVVPGSQLFRCDLRGLNLGFVSLTHVDLRGSRFEGVNFWTQSVAHARLRGRGLFGDAKALTREARDADLALFHAGDGVAGQIDRWIPWARIRALGSLPLFGVSNSALAFILVWGVMVATSRRLLEQGLESEFLRRWVEPVAGFVGPVGHSMNLAMLGVALILVALGAGIYRFACPDIVQEYSENKWVRELGQSMVEYRAASYSRPILRWISAFCYLLGLGFIVCYYLPTRACMALWALAS